VRHASQAFALMLVTFVDARRNSALQARNTRCLLSIAAFVDLSADGVQLDRRWVQTLCSGAPPGSERARKSADRPAHGPSGGGSSAGRAVVHTAILQCSGIALSCPCAAGSRPGIRYRAAGRHCATQVACRQRIVTQVMLHVWLRSQLEMCQAQLRA